MKLIDVIFVNPWVIVKFNCCFFMILVFIIFLFFMKYIKNKYRIKDFVFDEISLGIGVGKISLRCDTRNRDIAYKIWVELHTRKTGLPYDEDYDVILEVYNSWYKSFQTIRQLLKEIPVNHLSTSSQLINLTVNVLNQGLRSHLTKWQAKYRKWHDANIEEYKDLSPQDMQKKYPEYNELIKDLKRTNDKLIIYKNLIYQIAFE